MTKENSKNSVIFVITDTPVFSDASKRVARSNAAAWSRRRQKAAWTNFRSHRRDNSAVGKSGKRDDSVVYKPARVELPVGVDEGPSPTTLLDTALLDPFETTALPMDRKMSSLLRGCKLRDLLQCLFPSNFSVVTSLVTLTIALSSASRYHVVICYFTIVT